MRGGGNYASKYGFTAFFQTSYMVIYFDHYMVLNVILILRILTSRIWPLSGENM
jgi:hypothetical protein